MSALRYAAEERFRSVLHEHGRAAPQALTGLRCEREYALRRTQFIASFSNGTCVQWHVSDQDLHDYPPSPGSAAEHSCFIELRSLYSRMYEDHIMELELIPAREELERVTAEVWGTEEHRQAVERYRMFADHVRRFHQRPAPPPFQLPDARARMIAGAAVATPEDFARREAAQERQFRDAMHHVFMDRAREWYAPVLEGFTFDFDRVGDDAAKEKGLKLLKEWLSPEQLAQYEKDKCFEVVGSDTGRRYRIRHGRQMNIDELDEKGNRACGWCFLPEGALVAGDVMLAQKIALETDEKLALRTANRFP